MRKPEDALWIMRLIVFVLISPVLGVPQAASPRKSVPDPKAAPAKPKPSIPSDVLAAANHLWDNVVKKCGSKTYAVPLFFADGGTFHDDDTRTVRELDHPSYKIEAWPINRAEELNGIQWKGVAILGALAIFGADGQWREPYDPDEMHTGHVVRAFGMVKTSDVWRYMTLYGGSIRYETSNWDLDLAKSKDAAPSCPK